MASTPIGTATTPRAVTQLTSLERAGARLYWAGPDTTDLVYFYSDDNMATWAGRTIIAADEVQAVSLKYDAVNGRLNIAYGAENTVAKNLCLRAITSNVASGSPGALTPETVIAAAAANVGTYYPHIIHSATATNPRYWIVAEQQTGAGAYETRAWFVTAGSAADTGGNWSSTNFANLGGTSSAFGGYHMALGVWWQVGGAEKVTFVYEDGSIGQFRAATFDPTAVTPAPPASPHPVVATGYGNIDHFSQLLSIALNAEADYLVFGVMDADDSMWDFLKTMDGTTWAAPNAGWTNITMGRGSITKSGSDFYVVGSSAYSDLATTVQPLVYRKITTSGDVMGSQAAFSDTNGQAVTTPLDTGTSLLYAAYRGSTAAPYSVRSDTAVLTGQVLRPDADVTTTGWATAPLWNKLEESVAGGDVVTATAS